MVFKNHLDLTYNIFATMKGPLANNLLEKLLGVIRRGTYQEVSEDIRGAYAPVSDLWLDIDPNCDSSDDGSINKVII